MLWVAWQVAICHAWRVTLTQAPSQIIISCRHSKIQLTGRTRGACHSILIHHGFVAEELGGMWICFRLACNPVHFGDTRRPWFELQTWYEWVLWRPDAMFCLCCVWCDFMDDDCCDLGHYWVEQESPSYSTTDSQHRNGISKNRLWNAQVRLCSSVWKNWYSVRGRAIVELQLCWYWEANSFSHTTRKVQRRDNAPAPNNQKPRNNQSLQPQTHRPHTHTCMWLLMGTLLCFFERVVPSWICPQKNKVYVLTTTTSWIDFQRDRTQLHFFGEKHHLHHTLVVHVLCQDECSSKERGI